MGSAPAETVPVRLDRELRRALDERANKELAGRHAHPTDQSLIAKARPTETHASASVCNCPPLNATEACPHFDVTASKQAGHLNLLGPAERDLVGFKQAAEGVRTSAPFSVVSTSGSPWGGEGDYRVSLTWR
jgi:hypothetical protein